MDQTILMHEFTRLPKQLQRIVFEKQQLQNLYAIRKLSFIAKNLYLADEIDNEYVHVTYTGTKAEIPLKTIKISTMLTGMNLVFIKSFGYDFKYKEMPYYVDYLKENFDFTAGQIKQIISNTFHLPVSCTFHYLNLCKVYRFPFPTTFTRHSLNGGDDPSEMMSDVEDFD